MRDSRVLTHGSAALQGVVTGCIPPFPQVHIYVCGIPPYVWQQPQFPQKTLKARKSCLAQIKLLCALCMALQTCHLGGTCTAGYSVLSPPVCPIVRKADIHALRIANGHQISQKIYNNSMCCLGGRISVSVQFPCLSVTHWLNITEPLFLHLQNGEAIPKAVEWLH